MNVVIIYESLTGTTRKAAYRLADGLARARVDASVCSMARIDYAALGAADLVVIGTWTDGMVFIGQRPGRAQRIKQLPALDRKRCVVYCTYAVDPGKTLSKLSDIVTSRGGDVVGGMALRRLRLAEDVDDMVARLLETVVA